MKQQENEPITVKCEHCSKSFERAKLVGFSVVCPHCGRPHYGHLRVVSAKKVLNRVGPAQAIVCKHCGKTIDCSTVPGNTIVCPLCEKPQHEQTNLET